jgi:hypothetical protein
MKFVSLTGTGISDNFERSIKTDILDSYKKYTGI